jgi:hypothetical protein
MESVAPDFVQLAAPAKSADKFKKLGGLAVSDSGTFQVRRFATGEAWGEWMDCQPLSGRHYYETIFDWQRTRVYFDVDIERAEETLPSGEELLPVALARIGQIFNNCYGLEVHPDQMLVSSSHRPGKRSLHVLLPWSWADAGDRAAFHRFFKTQDLTLFDYANAVDPAVYKGAIRQFRGVGMTKPCKGGVVQPTLVPVVDCRVLEWGPRPFVETLVTWNVERWAQVPAAKVQDNCDRNTSSFSTPAPGKVVDCDDRMKEALGVLGAWEQCAKSGRSTLGKVTETFGGLCAEMRRCGVRVCPHGHRHTGDNFILRLDDDGVVSYHCAHTPECGDVRVTPLATVTPKPVPTDWVVPRERYQHFRADGVTPTVRPYSFDDKAVVVECTPPGGGKTTAMINFLKTMQNGEGILIICHRVSLIDELLKIIPTGLGIERYNPMCKLMSAPRLICCVNSVWKIASSTKFSVVFIDEITEVVKSLLAPVQRAANVWDRLCSVVEACPRVVVMSAHADEETKMLLDNIVPGRAQKWQMNDIKSERGIEMLTGGRQALLARIIECCSNGEHLSVPCAEKKDMQMLYDEVCEALPDMKFCQLYGGQGSVERSGLLDEIKAGRSGADVALVRFKRAAKTLRQAVARVSPSVVEEAMAEAAAARVRASAFSREAVRKAADGDVQGAVAAATRATEAAGESKAAAEAAARAARVTRTRMAAVSAASANLVAATHARNGAEDSERLSGPVRYNAVFYTATIDCGHDVQVPYDRVLFLLDVRSIDPCVCVQMIWRFRRIKHPNVEMYCHSRVGLLEKKDYTATDVGIRPCGVVELVLDPPEIVRFVKKGKVTNRARTKAEYVSELCEMASVGDNGFAHARAWCNGILLTIKQARGVSYEDAMSDLVVGCQLNAAVRNAVEGGRKFTTYPTKLLREFKTIARQGLGCGPVFDGMLRTAAHVHMNSANLAQHMVSGLHKLCTLQGSPFCIRENEAELGPLPDQSVVSSERIRRVLWRLRESEKLWPDTHWEGVRKRRSRGRGTQADDFDLMLAQYRAMIGRDHQPGELGCAKWQFEIDDVDDITTLMRHVEMNPDVRILSSQEDLCTVASRVMGLVDPRCHSRFRNRLALGDETDVSVAVTSDGLKQEALLLGEKPAGARMALLRPIVSALQFDVYEGCFRGMDEPVESMDADVIEFLRECVIDYRCVFKHRWDLAMESTSHVIRAVNSILGDCLGVHLIAAERDSTRKGRKDARGYVLVQTEDMHYFNFQASPGGRERCAEMLSGKGVSKRASADGDEDAGPCEGEVFDAGGDSVADGAPDKSESRWGRIVKNYAIRVCLQVHPYTPPIRLSITLLKPASDRNGVELKPVPWFNSDGPEGQQSGFSKVRQVTGPWPAPATLRPSNEIQSVDRAECVSEWVTSLDQDIADCLEMEDDFGEEPPDW